MKNYTTIILSCMCIYAAAPGTRDSTSPPQANLSGSFSPMHAGTGSPLAGSFSLSICAPMEPKERQFTFERFPLTSVESPSATLQMALQAATNSTEIASDIKEKAAADAKNLSMFIASHIAPECTIISKPYSIIKSIIERNKKNTMDSLHTDPDRPYVILEGGYVAGLVIIGYNNNLEYFEVLPGKGYHQRYAELVASTVLKLFEDREEVFIRTYHNNDGIDHTSTLLTKGWRLEKSAWMDPIADKIIKGETAKLAAEGYVWTADLKHGGQAARDHLKLVRKK